MELLYVQEHLTCYNYEKNGVGAIDTLRLSSGEAWEFCPIDNEIMFVLEGKLKFVIANEPIRDLTAGKMMMVPSNINFKGTVVDDVYIVIMRLRARVQLCDTYALEKLLEEVPSIQEEDSGWGILDINERIADYLDFLNGCVSDGLRCFHYLQLKVKELFFLLRVYYKKEELWLFFNPLLSRDITFSDFVSRNCHKARTVKELAELSNYSLSGFQKRFKRVFNVSAHQWLNEHRSKAILHDINNSQKTLKEISNEYGFSSPSYFNDFCKVNFGLTPGKLRKESVE